MPTTGTQKFYVSTSPFDNFNIANTNAAGFDASDRERLFFHYNPAAGKVTLDPQGNQYGRANTLGGQYSFDTRGDYLNEPGWLGGQPNQPIRPTGSGLDRNISPVTGAGGGTYANDLRIGLPSSPSGLEGASGEQCPYGFYRYNNVCVPGVNMDPTNPANILGINNGVGSYQQPKGVITRVIPPVRTELGKIFQIVTEIQNIGNKPGKFYTKVSVPALALGEVQSNSSLVAPGQKAVIYQSLQMPTAVSADSLMQVKSDLYKQFIESPGATPSFEDTNTAQLPNPSTVLGMPPLTPPVPNFPLPTGGQQQGYPYSSPPPPLYSAPPYGGYPLYSQGPYSAYPQMPGPIYMGMHSRAYGAYKQKGPWVRKPKHSNSPFAVPPFGNAYGVRGKLPMNRAFAASKVTENVEDMMPEEPSIMVSPQNPEMTYDAGDVITIRPMGFEPDEPVAVQFYTTTTSMNVTKLQTKLGSKTLDTDEDGITDPVRIEVPNKSGKTIVIVAIGTVTEKKVNKKINVA